MSLPARVLLVLHPGVGLGGTETLLARLARHLLLQGCEVDVLFVTTSVKGAIIRLMPPEARVLFVDPWKARLFPFACRRLFSELYPEYRHVLACSSKAFFIATVLRDLAGVKGRYLFYVVNPGVFKRGKLDRSRRLILTALKREPVGSFVFMHERYIRNWSKSLGRDLSACRVVPLPIEARRRVPYRPKSCARIVSIGRVDHQVKPYNWSLIAPFKELRERGVDFEWHIFGGGLPGQVESLEEAIEEAGCRDFIFYEGEVGYDDMEAVLADTHLFVGMGTAAVEAASAGIPTIVARGYSSRPESHGLLHELPFGNVGEEIRGGALVPIAQLVERVLSMSEDEYLRLRERSAQAAREYDMGSSVMRLLKEDDGQQSVSIRRTRLVSAGLGLSWLLLRTWGRFVGLGKRVVP